MRIWLNTEISVGYTGARGRRGRRPARWCRLPWALGFGRQPPRARRWASLSLVLAFVSLGLPPLAAWAQLTQYSVYQGRLTDDSGAAQTGPVDLELRIYGVASGGVPLYSEQHLAVALGPNGMFSVPLGNGTSASGSYDATLLSGTPRYVEVVVGGVEISPRQPIGTVPTALVAEVLAPPAARFEACADGLTVADHQTGLLWERKTNPSGVTPIDPANGHDCTVLPQPAECAADPHDVRNRYRWSNPSPDPNGVLFTDFLARLNGDPTITAATFAQATGDPADDPTVCFSHHCDWRLPVITELTTILIGPGAAAGQDPSCAFPPCIDPDFAAVGGATASWDYWTASADAFGIHNVLLARFSTGVVAPAGRSNSLFVRAVRAGSCD